MDIRNSSSRGMMSWADDLVDTHLLGSFVVTPGAYRKKRGFAPRLPKSRKVHVAALSASAPHLRQFLTKEFNAEENEFALIGLGLQSSLVHDGEPLWVDVEQGLFRAPVTQAGWQE